MHASLTISIINIAQLTTHIEVGKKGRLPLERNIHILGGARLAQLKSKWEKTKGDAALEACVDLAPIGHLTSLQLLALST